MIDECEPEPTFAALYDLACDPSPESVSEFTRVLRAHTPLDSEIYAKFHYTRWRASWEPTPAWARSLADQFTHWWRGIKALAAADADADACIVRTIAVIACGPDEGLAARAAGVDRALLTIVQRRRLGAYGKTELDILHLYYESLLGRLRGLISDELTVFGVPKVGEPRCAPIYAFPFYLALQIGSLAHVQAAADWCNPSPVAIKFGLRTAIQRVRAIRFRKRWEDDPDYVSTAQAQAPTMEWLFARVQAIDLDILSEVDRCVNWVSPHGLGAYLELYRRMLFFCPALVPRAAGLLLADAEWDEAVCGWARGALEEIARRELRCAWIAAVVTGSQAQKTALRVSGKD